MADREPSHALQHPLLLHHLHLVVEQRFPYTPNQLVPDSAIRDLLQAPRVVRDRPVKWQYLSTPQDGTLFIAWQPTNQVGTTYASDGYVWAGLEKGPHEVHGQGQYAGCRLEVFLAEAGFSPGHEQICLHRRTRYRLTASPNGSHEPMLELVHYTAALPDHQFPANRVPLTPQIQETLSKRRYLEAQGHLAEKHFMLHDKMNYPTITVPGSTIPSNPYQQAVQMYGRGPGMNRGPPQPGAPRPGMGPSPHKRGVPSGARPGGAMYSNPFPPAQPVPEYLKDEDNHVYGDSLDFLTPREISSARYKQHHEWMEEILSSPYSTTQILPVNLGLKLNGELGQLTDGLYRERPDSQSKETQKVAYDDGVNVDAIPAFERRVQDFITKGEAEIAEMKRLHNEKMAVMSQQKLYANLERKLTGQPANENLEEITREAETASGARIIPREMVVQISKGGILENVEQLDTKIQDSDEFVNFEGMDTAGEALDFFDHGMDYSTG